MRFLVLIDQLDDLIHNAKAVPLTDQVRVDKGKVYDLLDEMRATLSDELTGARQETAGPAESNEYRTQRLVLEALLEADPGMVDVADLRARFGYVDVVVQRLVDDGLASRLGDGLGATRAAVRFAELSRGGAATA